MYIAYLAIKSLICSCILCKTQKAKCKTNVHPVTTLLSHCTNCYYWYITIINFTTKQTDKRALTADLLRNLLRSGLLVFDRDLFFTLVLLLDLVLLLLVCFSGAEFFAAACPSKAVLETSDCCKTTLWCWVLFVKTSLLTAVSLIYSCRRSAVKTVSTKCAVSVSKINTWKCISEFNYSSKVCIVNTITPHITLTKISIYTSH